MALFRRRDEAEDAERQQLRLYYASDIHGTEVLWRKFLHAPGGLQGAPVIVMGGDVTGKAVIPLVEDGGGAVTAELFGRRSARCTPEERDASSSTGSARTGCTRT